MPIELRRFEAVWKLLGSRIDDVCLSFGPLVRAALTKDFCRLHWHLNQYRAYAIIIMQTSVGPCPFALLAVLVREQRRLVAMPLGTSSSIARSGITWR